MRYSQMGCLSVSRILASATGTLCTLGGDFVALKRMSIKVSEEMHSWLAVEAEKRGLTMNAIIIFALENYYTQSSMAKAVEIYDKQQRNG